MTVDLHYIFELTIYSLINMAPYIIFAFYVFTGRLRYSFKTTGLLVVIVLFIQVFSRLYGTIDNGILPVLITLPRLASYFLFYLVAIRAHLGKKVFVLFMISNLSSLVSIGAHCIESILFAQQEHHSFCLHSSLIMLLLHAAISLPFLYTILRFSKTILAYSPSGKEWRYYWLIPATFTFMWMYHVYGSSDNALNIVQNPKTLIFLLIIHLSGLLIYYLVIKLSSQLQTNLELERKNHLLDIERIEYNSLYERIEETRRSRHDLRHHILVMSDYLDNQEYDSLKKYFMEFKESIPEIGDFLFCPNRPVNRLIFFFATQAQNHGIDFQVNLELPPELNISESDISILLGNLLENALDACKEQKSLQKKIVISGKSDNRTLYFTIDNTFENAIKKTLTGEFITTKKNGSGIGLQSVKNVVKKYNGVFTAEQKNNVFYTSFMLNL